MGRPIRGLDPLAVDAGVDAAFVLLEARPASIAIGLASLKAARAWYAADGDVTIVHQRVAREIVAREMRVDVSQRPIAEWIETESAVEEFDSTHCGALARLKPLAAGNERGKSVQRALERLHLAKRAARVGIARPQRPFGILVGARNGMRTERANIRQSK